MIGWNKSVPASELLEILCFAPPPPGCYFCKVLLKVHFIFHFRKLVFVSAFLSGFALCFSQFSLTPLWQERQCLKLLPEIQVWRYLSVHCINSSGLLQIHRAEQRPPSTPHFRLQWGRRGGRRWRVGRAGGRAGRGGGRGRRWRGLRWGLRGGRRGQSRGRAGQRLWRAGRGEPSEEEEELWEAGGCVEDGWWRLILFLGVSLNKNSLTTSALCDRSTGSDPYVFSGCSSSVHWCGEFQWPWWAARPRTLPGAQWVWMSSQTSPELVLQTIIHGFN